MHLGAFGYGPEIELPVLSTSALGKDLDKTWRRLGYGFGMARCIYRIVSTRAGQYFRQFGQYFGQYKRRPGVLVLSSGSLCIYPARNRL